MGFLANIYRSTYLRYALPTIIYFAPALYFQYVIDVDRKDWRILVPPASLYIVTYIHQLLFSSPATPVRFPYPIDLLLTVLEMAAYIIIWRLSSSSDPAFLSLAAFDLVIFCAISLIGCLKLGDVIADLKSRRGPWAQYDYLTARPWSGERSEGAKMELKERGLTFYISRLLIGLFVYFTIAFAWNTIIIAPIREAASIPLRALKSLHHPNHDLTTGVSDVWNVIVGCPTEVRPNLTNNSLSLAWASAVEVVLLSNESNRTLCNQTLWKNTDLPQKDLFTNTPMKLDAIAFGCPYNPKANILVAVNFTKLGDSAIGSSVVQVMLGSVADDPTEVIRRTEVPALLIPGNNFVGFAKMHILQKFKRPKLSTLGLFGSYNTFLVSDIVNLSTDPQSLSLTSSPDLQVATMRIIPLVDLADWRIIQEYRDRSVLKGFSIVGGLWTFLGGVFAFLFGKSISFIVFNIKPLSAFGLVDQFQKDSVRTQYRKDYPDIERDIAGKGYNKYMVDHFVALDLIKTSNSSTADATQPALTIESGTGTILQTPRSETLPLPGTPQTQAAHTATSSGSELTVPTPPQLSQVQPAAVPSVSRSGAPVPTPPVVHETPQASQPEVPAVATDSGSGSAPTSVPTLSLPSQAQPASNTDVSAPPAVAAASDAGEQAGPHGPTT